MAKRLFPQSPQVRFRADEQRIVRHSIGRQSAFRQIILGKQRESLASFHHETGAGLVLKINPPVRAYRRGGEIAAQPLIPVDFSGARVRARRHAAVGNEVEFVAHHEQRRRMGRALADGPGDVGFGDIRARTRRLDRQNRRMIKARRDEQIGRASCRERV